MNTRSRTLLSPLLTVAILITSCAGSDPAPDVPPSSPTALDVPPSSAGPAGPSTAAAQPTAAPSEEPSAPAGAPATAAGAASPAASASPAESASPASPAATAPAAASGPAGANLRVGSMTVDGLTIEDLACRADGLGLLGSMLVAGGIAKKKAALVACAPKGDSPRVEWTAAKGKVTVASVKASSPAVEACVKKALTGTPAPFEGECAATLALGK